MIPNAINVWVVVPLVVALGTALLWWLAERGVQDRRLARAVCLSFVGRVVIGMTLYEISYWGWPILTSLQTVPGFWAFGLDSKVYHDFGTGIAAAWAKGIELPNTDLGIEYVLVVGLVYRLLGSHPLYPMLLNGWLAAASGLLAYLIGRRLFDQRTAFGGALLVMWWPSSMLWSSQLLKDALSWILIFLVIWLTVSAAWGPGKRERSAVRWIALCLALVCVEIALTRLRFYLGSAFSLAALVTLLPAGGFALLRRETGRGLRCLGIAAILVLSTLYARTLDPLALVSTAHPERGHFALAVKHRDRAELDRAEDEFRQAIVLAPNYREAYLGLATIKVQQGKLDEALEVYTGYLEREDPKKRQIVKQIIATIYTEQGNHDAAQGQWAQAGAAYEHALLFDPTSVPVHVNFGIVLASQEKFEIAATLLDKALTLVEAGDDETRTLIEQARGRVEQLRADVELARLEAERARLEAERAQLMIMPGAPVGAVQMEEATGGAHARGAPQASRGHQTPPSKGGDIPHPRTSPGLAVRGRPSRTRRTEPPNLAPLLMPHDGRQLIAMALAVFPTESGASETRPSQAPSERLEQLVRGVSQIDEQAFESAYETTPVSLGARRAGFVASGGYSLMDAWAQISSPRKMVTYLPRALAIGLLAPFPWQWFDVHGSTGIMRVFAGIEMCLFYLLVPCLGMGIWRELRQPRAERLFLLAFIFMTFTAVSLVVANLGTLFRLRLLFLLPLLLFAAAGRPIELYRALMGRVAAIGRPAMREEA